MVAILGVNFESALYAVGDDAKRLLSPASLETRLKWITVAFWRKRDALLCGTNVPQHPLGNGLWGA
jgi:hypothetical protein